MDDMERISWIDRSGARSTAVVGAPVENHHGDGHVTYTPETVRSITRGADGYRVNLQGGRQPFIWVPEKWVTRDE